jgi:hypothetical protein
LPADTPASGWNFLDPKKEGDKLTICYTVFNVRPTDFSMGKGIAAIKRLVVLTREKK